MKNPFRYPKDHARAKARRRLVRLKDEDILNWTDQCGTGVVKALDDFRRLGDPTSLLEAAQGVSALAGAVDALRDKHGV